MQWSKIFSLWILIENILMCLFEFKLDNVHHFQWDSFTYTSTNIYI